MSNDNLTADECSTCGGKRSFVIRDIEYDCKECRAHETGSRQTEKEAEDAYFAERHPSLDRLDNRAFFRAGFERASQPTSDEPMCPRPFNGRPQQFTMAECILAGECGCTKAACAARDEKPTEATRRPEDFEWWGKVVYPDGMTAEQVQNELADFHFMMEQVPKVYMEVTGGKLSKPNYTAEAIIGEFQDHLEDLIEQAIKEDREDRESQPPEDVCSNCGIELVSDICDKCGSLNTGDSHGN